MLCRSQEVGLKESEAEVESVVGSVVRGGERELLEVAVMMRVERRVVETIRRKLVSLLVTEKCMCQALVKRQFLMMTALKSMRALLQLGLSILPPVMSAMTLITWHGRKVIFSRN